MVTRGTFMTVLMALAFVLAGYLIYTRVIQKPPRETTEIVVCKNPTCHYVFEVRTAASKGGAPYECPNCGQKSAYLAFQCTDPDCGAVFPVTPAQMKSGEPIRCPVCGHQAEVLLHIPEDAERLSIKGAVPR
jgi:DNA-directed RNA polymerase subunit RPC12/RpoP